MRRSHKCNAGHRPTRRGRGGYRPGCGPRLATGQRGAVAGVMAPARMRKARAGARGSRFPVRRPMRPALYLGTLFTPLCNPLKAKGPPPVAQRAALSVSVGQAQCTTASCGRSRRVAATRSPMISPSTPAPILTVAPSSTSPDRIISASGSCSDRCITRFSGRAP